MSDNPPIYLLSVGVNKYKNEAIKSLRGCVPDVQLLQSVFQSQFGVPDENIKILLDEQADSESILAGFRSHLTENARKWKERNDDSPSPAFVFHFSGHGSVCRDKTQDPYTFDETTMPFDARTPGKYDIRDWQLRQYIDELSAFTDNVTIILDCCCSGSGTRDADEDDDDSNTRAAPMDERDQPEYKPTVATPVEKPAGTRSTSSADEDTQPSVGHVLLAACRSFEKAKEHSHTDENGNKIKYGAFTLFLAQELSQLPTDRTLTYHELLGRVRLNVQREYASQSPQCEGDVHRELFGGARPKRDTMFDVTDPADGLFKVNAGRVHGITKGLVVDVFPPGTAAASDAQSVTAVVEDLQATHSFCRMSDNSTPEIMSRVKPRNAGFGGKIRRVAFDLADANLKSKLVRDCNEPQLAITESTTYADLVVRKVAGLLEIQDPSGARLVAPFQLNGENAAPPVSSGATSARRANLCQALCAIAQYRNTLELNNTSPSSQLNNTGMSIEILELGFGVALEGLDNELYGMLSKAIDQKRKEGFGKDYPSIAVVRSDQSPHFVVRQDGNKVCVEDTNQKVLSGPLTTGPSTVSEVIKALMLVAKTEYETEKPQGRPRDPARAIPQTSDGRPIVVENGWYMLKVTNQSPQVLHWEVLAFGYNYSVVALKKMLVEQTNLEDKELLGTSHAAHQPGWLKLKYESTINDKQFVEANEWMKAIGTMDKVDYSFVQQPGLIIEATRWGSGKTYEEDWTTANLQYVVVREDPERVSLASGKKTSIPQFELSVTAPSGFGGHAEVRTPLQSTLQNDRTKAETTPIPPAISTTTNRHPVTMQSTRAIGIDAAEVELTMPAEESSRVSRDTPVSLHIKDSGNDRLLSVSHDGDLFFPLGISEDPATAESDSETSERTVPVVWTPPQQGETTDRSALRSIRLLVYRVLKQTPPELGVHHAEVISVDDMDLSLPARYSTVDNGVVRYTSLQNTDLSTSKRIALVIHGLGGQSDWMVANTVAEFAARGVTYDAVLTFDYETIVTPIRTNAQALAKTLKAQGFSADDNFELDIFADGSGGLVARSMIEQSGGADFVDRCFMTGTPHNGTPIAHASRLAPILGTLAMNAIFPGATTVVGTFIGNRLGNSEGTTDLQPTSNFIKTLNASDSTPKTRYFALAGTGPANQGKQERWSNFVRQSVDSTLTAIPALFDSRHDMLVSTHSATEIRNGDYPGSLLETKCIPGTHFEYFQNSAVWDQLSEWIKG